jgi:hypothetical protein
MFRTAVAEAGTVYLLTQLTSAVHVRVHVRTGVSTHGWIRTSCIGDVAAAQ